MPKPPDTWPPAALPGRMNGECAAYFLGISVSMLREGLKAGRYPVPVRDRGKVLWLTSDLQDHIDRERNPSQADAKGYWLGKLRGARNQIARSE